jgi:heme/copper-type cytochrome/quinol oxidase subunit 4
MPTLKLYVGIWLGLIAIVAIETVLAFSHLSTSALIASLLLLAIVEAGVALRYFMHLKYEPPALFWTLIPAIVFALLMMNQVWPDARRPVSLHFP